MRRPYSFWLVLATGGLFLPVPVTIAADSAEGVVRLGDAQRAWNNDTQAPGSTQQVGFHHYNQSWTTAGPACGAGCQTGYGCPGGYGYGDCGYGNCGKPGCISRLHNHLCNHVVGGCHYPPDHGWAPPGKFPRPRQAVTYRRYFPGSWTGEPGYGESDYRYPMVYTPTDTTQLGYYYQRVPVWQARAGMIPPTPHPAQFHVPDFGIKCNGVVDAGACGVQGEYVSGYAAGGEYVIQSGTPVESAPAPVESAPPATQPAPVETPPAAPPYIPSAPATPAPTPPAPVPVPEAAPAAAIQAPGLEKSAATPSLYIVPPHQ